MAVSIARKELRPTLITILTPETERKGITTLDIQMFISITIMLNNEHKTCIEKHVPFVDYITIHFISVGKKWKHTKG